MHQNKIKFLISFLLVRLLSLPLIVQAQEPISSEPIVQTISEEIWNAKFQATYLWQRKQSFSALYSGTNSLGTDPEHAYSLTATAFLGYRPWKGAELYLNPEMIQAVPFSELHGLGGLTNSEQQKTSGPNPKFYRARAYLKQTFGFDGGSDPVESAPNQLAGMVDKRRLVVTVGNLGVIDLFDNNAYSHDPRTQFTNWSFLTHGAYDYAADARGYTSGFTTELYYDDWALRVGRFMGPAESNGLPLDTRIMKHHGDQIEIERSHTINDMAGKVRLMAFRNKEIMGNYEDAIVYAQVNGSVPDVSSVRRENFKIGYGLSLEQSLRSDIGVFARASWADGKSETYSFTEIERSITAGLLVKGDRWERPKDSAGIAVAQNGLSGIHQKYLSLGGLGAFIGDGQLNYQPERIIETFYNANLYKATWLAAGYQRIVNPAYNGDRGPVNVLMLRLHTEF
ncbi:high affinity Mn2+ porin [Undibacterium sp. GrIS 1.8]|uniref:carbohydrate porin n=1 Tax=Undibacterium sp. GrIS 1.8 TaxID=3143934 RepID=UPI003391FCBF